MTQTLIAPSTYSPAEATRRLIAEAREQALKDEWAQYEEENRRHRETRGLDIIRRARNGSPIEHGYKGYRRGCKCNTCKDGYNAWYADYRIRSGITKKHHTGRTHGLPGTYQNGCRCDPCSTAGRAYAKLQRDKRKARQRAEVSEQQDTVSV